MTDTTAITNSPFIVGVSGHRDLDPEGTAKLRSTFAAFVGQMREQLPDTELRVIVGMAEGADLLVAEAALELGVPVDAVLPMPLEHYVADFEAHTLELLRDLLGHPGVRCVALPLPTHGDHTLVPSTPAERTVLYSALTDTLIDSSSLLLALWDGQPSSLPGGTADTVLRYLGLRAEDSREPARLEFVEAPGGLSTGTRLVYWMPTDRHRGDTLNGDRAPCFLQGVGDNVLHVQHSLPAPLRQQLALLNRYNRNFIELTAERRLGRGDSLLATLSVELPPDDRRALARIDAQYAKADALAIYYQRHSDRLFALFAAMAFLMGLAYLIYEKLGESPLMIDAYIVILAVGLALYYRLGHRQWFAKHLVCRVIAESLRAKFYLRMASADHLVDIERVLALSGIDEFPGFRWVHHVIKSVGAHGDYADATAESVAEHVAVAERSWIESQHRYFTRKVLELERSSRHVTLLKNLVFALILAVVTTLALFGEAVARLNVGVGVSMKDAMTFSMGAAAVLLGVWELHQSKMATRELLWQYRNQREHFARARARLARIAAPDRRQQVLAELGETSLMESYLWTIHRYHREHEPPTAR